MHLPGAQVHVGALTAPFTLIGTHPEPIRTIQQVRVRNGEVLPKRERQHLHFPTCVHGDEMWSCYDSLQASGSSVIVFERLSRQWQNFREVIDDRHDPVALRRT